MADRLQQRVGRLQRDPSGDGDWIDQAGRVYDAVGPVPDAKFFDAASFDAQIDKHLLKQGVDEIRCGRQQLDAGSRKHKCKRM